MVLYLTALFVLLASALASLACGRGRAANLIGPFGCMAGCLLGLAAAVSALAAPVPPALALPWSVPFGAVSLVLDPLSAFFLIPPFLLGAAAALYGRGYLAGLAGTRHLGAHWFFYGLMILGMALMLCAANAVLFLVSWEIMSLCPFFLVSLDHEEDRVRTAARTYLIAAHLGTALLMAFFLILGHLAGSMEFSAMARVAPQALSPLAPALFFLALAGFGVKAGLFPLHVWLPEAHPAAPSHVSAFMSGALIKAGVYGVLRALTLLGPPDPWMGQTLVALGLLTGVLGLLTGLGQGEFKRFLAFSSIENMGIVFTAMGIGVLAEATGHPDTALFAFAGLLFHVASHALLKGMLFFGAGNVLHAVGHALLERLGGLSRRMPHTALACFAAGAAISGLPPGNAFFGELLLYVGAGLAVLSMPLPEAVWFCAAIAGLAFIGGLSAIGFTRAVGIVFSGEPRSADAAGAHDPSPCMRAAMWLLFVCALGMGLGAPLAFTALTPVIRELLAAPPTALPALPAVAVNPVTLLTYAVWMAFGTAALALVLAFTRNRLLSGRGVRSHGTWDCGYIKPTARMQYTASSYAEPMTVRFRRLLGEKRQFSPPRGLFPATGTARYASETPDRVRDGLFAPLFSAVATACDALKTFQHGNLNLYILYILVTLVILLALTLAGAS